MIIGFYKNLNITFFRLIGFRLTHGHSEHTFFFLFHYIIHCMHHLLISLLLSIFIFSKSLYTCQGVNKHVTKIYTIYLPISFVTGIQLICLNEETLLDGQPSSF